MDRNRIAEVIRSLITASALTTADAADWPGFLGPHGNGTSSETNLLEQFPAGGPRVLWSRDLGTGYAAPSVIGSRLVVFHREGEEEIVECLDAATGNSRWRHAYPSRFEDPYGYNNGPRSAPLLTTNRCFTFGAEGRLSCLDLETGRPLWHRDTAKDWQVPEAFFGVGSSPVLAGDRLLVMVGGQPDAGMAAFDAATGRTLWESVGQKTWTGQPMLGWPGQRTVVWRANDKQASYATPVLATVHGRPTAFCLMRQGLVSLNPATGEVNFVRWFRAQVEESVNAANPVVVDDLVLISAAYYRLGSVLLRVQPDGHSFEEVWKSTAIEAHWSTPVHADGYLYAFSGRNEPDARFRCVELRTGRIRWERDESWGRRSTRQPPTYGRGSCILADNKLIVFGEGGLLGLFRVNPERPEELARWQVPSLEYPTWAGPVLSNRRLFLRGEQRLVCLDLKRE
ncbi:MAG: PQQ-like beta-propeller repeat protein [Verrucomicrobia bacterium]|nr:PQQ-like beta-propeller repeat protein [Verrucomicrobiota bacterium]